MDKHPSDEVIVAVVGKYTGMHDSYISVIKALKHAALEAVGDVRETAVSISRIGYLVPRMYALCCCWLFSDSSNRGTTSKQGPPTVNYDYYSSPPKAGLHLSIEWVESSDLEPNAQLLDQKKYDTANWRLQGEPLVQHCLSNTTCLKQLVFRSGEQCNYDDP